MKLNLNFRRLVIKLGTSILTDSQNRLDTELIKNLVRQISSLIDEGREIIIVSSGAIASGLSLLGYSKRPSKLDELTALASLGQIALMQAYEQAFEGLSKHCAQVLLTWDDFDNRSRFLNAKKTLNQLFEYKAVPIINENDSVSTEEIKFGDNDKLSALVTNLVSADLLILLSDVEGLFDRKQNILIKCVEKVDSKIMRLGRGSEKFSCVGGMSSKLEAIKIVNDAGIPAVLANGRAVNILTSIVRGENPGTFFCAGDRRLAKKSWIASSTKPKGTVVVDAGAREAIVFKKKSLLSVGIKEARGDFKQNDIVFVSDTNGVNFAKGIARFSQHEINQIKGKKNQREVIHCNDLVVLK